MPTWEVLDSPEVVVKVIRPIDRSDLNAQGTEFETSAVLLIPISRNHLVELSEALFLEERQPIAVFDKTQSELIIIRVLTALWPAIRRTFCTCSFSIGPRT